MQSINALSQAPDVESWLASSHEPHILHIFDRACNLINERGEVLSIVTPEIGDGPFNLVTEDNVIFSRQLHIESPVSMTGSRLNVGNLTIDTGTAQLWNPCPDWAILHDHRDKIAHQVQQLRFSNYKFSNALPSSLVAADLRSSIATARTLAGLGVGLTPSGDDFMMGAIYATWIIHPPETAGVLADAIANTAASLTTSLSAAWLRAARMGEAGILWHEFLDAFLFHDPVRIQETLKNILAVGETSGVDALSGFISVFKSWRGEAGSKHG